LLKAGRKVAICDQVEEARPGQLVKREVTQILSPGTHFDERLLKADQNNYLVALCHFDGAFGLALVDLTTGEFKTTSITEESALLAELERIRPAELIHPGESGRVKAILERRPCLAIPVEDWIFAPETAQFTLRDHFKVASLDGFGLKGQTACVGAAGAIVHYLATSLRRDIQHLRRLSYYQTGDFLILDTVTLRNLEVLEPLHREAPRTACLYGALNRTVTPMGARRLRDWLAQPLAKVEAIHARQEALQRLTLNGPALETLRRDLAEVRDLERTLGRLGFGSGNARDLVALRDALEKIPPVRAVLLELHNSPDRMPPLQEEMLPAPAAGPGEQLLGALRQEMTEAPDLVDLIRRSIADEPPLAVKEGGMIKPGYDAALDELRRASTEGKEWIAKLQQEEIEKTGIASLKIRFNSVFGYYIEVTKANLDKVPAHYIRKQTIANGERYITPELKEMEGKILGAEERTLKLEYELFLKVRDAVLGRMAETQATAGALAQADALGGLAETARLYNYCRPEIGREGVLKIEEGRHPVLDQAVLEERFVPNDCHLDAQWQMALITGPNMAGKSTYIRQTALLALMAHTGSFLPARRARVDLLDRIFTRIGASDDLSRGQSTFMVEMTETANILNNASRDSLIILDEVGRGTSTFDGLSLAWSIVEHLHNQVGAKTLFATHYHELTELAGRLSRVKNLNVAVREWNDQIVFLRKIVEGGADKSYGIQVARLAGVPQPVLERAREILQNLEESELTPEGKPRHASRRRAEREKLKNLTPPPQLDLFS
jgi:DNA mismatch repair protein MutS